MKPSVRRHFALIILVFNFLTLAAAQEKPGPLSDRELLALLAGNALSENIVHEIQSRGLAFRAGTLQAERGLSCRVTL